MTEPVVDSIDGKSAVVPADQIPADEVQATEEVLVLDFGGQYSQLIARRIRECGVFAELLPANADVERIRARKPKALVLSGGPASVYEDGAPAFPTQLLDLDIPLLGICYGMQAMALALGGKVEGAEAGEFGRTELTLRDGRRQAARRPARGAELLDEPPRHRPRGARGLHPAGLLAELPGGGLRDTPTAASTASSSTPRSSTRPTGPRSSPASSATSPAAPTSGAPNR